MTEAVSNQLNFAIDIDIRSLALYVILIIIGGLLAIVREATYRTGQAGPERLAEKYPKKARQLRYWSGHWDQLSNTLWLLSMLLDIGVITLAVFMSIGETATPHNWATPVFLLITAALFMLTLHVLPRSLSAGYAHRITLGLLPATILLTRLFFPLVAPLSFWEKRLRQHFVSESDDEDRPSTEDAIRNLVDSSDGDMALDEEEKEIIRSVFEFGETVTREIMQPRVDMEGFEDHFSVDHCATEVKKLSHSRFPVYHENMDDIRGVVHVRDLLRALNEDRKEQQVISLAKPLPFVPESMPINDLLQMMRRQQAQMAVVVDEYGGTAGLVTVEDIVEELVGDIQDEFDTETEGLQRLPDGTAIAEAWLPVDDTNELLSTHIPISEEYDSLGGFLLHSLGRIPRSGEQLEGCDFHITVQTANPRKVDSVRIKPLHPPEDEKEN